MSLLTTFFNLIKPAKTDGVKVSDFNANMDTIDTEMHRPPLTVNGIEPDSTTRDLYLESVPLADNLTSDVAQVNDGEFIERTSGGDSSIDDGDASLLFVKGNMVHTGYVAESIEHTESEGLTVTIDRDTFVGYVSQSGTLNFTYTTSWTPALTNYGITVAETPQNGDTITVVYVKEERGTITPASPSAFISTGWNLYNNTDGYAKVIAYSETYGYKLGGTYSLIEFATTTTGTRSAVTVVDGYFNVPADGYVFITGGDATTYVYATWTDWTDSYEGDFESYAVDTIDLSEAMLNFPNGLCAVHDVRDEINLNVGRTIQRIGRTDYSNLATIVASGADYVYDTNYVYYVLETPVTTAIEIDPVYTVNDHGIEYFSGTTVACVTETLYGENLKDKLRTDVLTISEQELTDSQKEQVHKNIGVPPLATFGKVKVGTNESSMSCTSGSYKALSSLALDPGSYIITANGGFTTSYNGLCYLGLYNGSTNLVTVFGTSEGNGGNVNLAYVYSFTTARTLTVKMYQNSGSAKTATMNFRAMRIL